MPVRLIINCRSTGFRVLALAVLLFVIGLQVQEAGHSHSLDDRAAQCMLCKQSVDDALPVGAKLIRVAAMAVPRFISHDIKPKRTVRSPVLARGPPANS